MTPTRSEVENWDTEHLDAAADHWSKTATVWEDHFSHYANQVANPGGTPWEGEAAEAAQQQAHSDRLIVCGLADQLQDASTIARRGANELREACRLVMRSVHSAEDGGFTVGEDFSVTDDHMYSRAAAAIRQSQAEAHATAIRAAVADLVAADGRIATELTTAASGLGQDHFGDQEVTSVPGGDQKDVAKALMGIGEPSQKAGDKNVADELLSNAADGAAQQNPMSDSVLANVAGQGNTATEAAKSALYQIGKAALGEKKDWVVGAPLNYTSILLNSASDLARPGAAGSPAWVQKSLAEVKMGKLPVGSVSGLSVGGLGAGVSFLIDQNKPGMTTTHAAVRNGAALVVGAIASAPFDATVAGIPAGIVVGTGAGNLAAAGVDFVWDPLAKAQEVFYEAGGPGAAMKAARWGR